jgi:hypothetical protein
MLFCCLLMLIAILFLLKTEEEKIKNRPPNAIYEVILTWDGESEDDLDLYVRAASGHTIPCQNNFIYSIRRSILNFLLFCL